MFAMILCSHVRCAEDLPAMLSKTLTQQSAWSGKLSLDLQVYVSDRLFSLYKPFNVPFSPIKLVVSFYFSQLVDCEISVWRWLVWLLQCTVWIRINMWRDVLQRFRGRTFIEYLSVEQSRRIIQMFMLVLTYALFWVLTSCSMVGECHRFRGTHYLRQNLHTHGTTCYNNPQCKSVGQNSARHLFNLWFK
jgi:hypothetical protein